MRGRVASVGESGLAGLTARLLLAVALVFVSAACDRSKMPFLGMWTGSFVVESVGGRSGARELAAYRMDGFLQLYAGGNFKMGMHNRAQAIDLTGTWKFHRRRATLKFTDVSFDETSVDELRALGRPFVPPSDLREAYGKGLILDIAPGGKELVGLKIAVGPLVGAYRLHKGQR